MKRFGRPEELANLAAYLVSEQAGYVNGECVVIDGGEWLRGAGEFNHFLDLPGVRVGRDRSGAQEINCANSPVPKNFAHSEISRALQAMSTRRQINHFCAHFCEIRERNGTHSAFSETPCAVNTLALNPMLEASRCGIT